jgi:hypothetical protein
MNDEQLVNDKRVSIAQACNGIALVSALVGIMTTKGSSEDQTILSIVVTFYASVILIGQFLLRRNRVAFIMFTVLSVYVWIAYPLKVVVLLHDPMSSWVSHQLFEANVVQREISDAFYTVVPGIIALFLGFLIGGKGRSFDRGEKVVLRHSYFIAIILALMLLKLFVQTFLGIGLPGVKPQMVGVPLVAGLLDLLTRPTLFVLVNLYFYCVLRLNERRGLLPGLCLMLVNVLLAVRVGWKSELVIQGLIIGFYLVDVYGHMEPRRRRFVGIAAIVIMVATINLYTFVAEYRNYIVSGRTMSEAIEKAEGREKKSMSSLSLAPIYNRINGIDAYYAAVKLGKGKTFPLESLVSDNVMDLIKEKLYGYEKDKAVTAFGTTQFSVLYLIGGEPFLVLGCFGLGWMFRCLAMWIKDRLLTFETTFHAFLPFLCILWVKVLSAGGMLFLYFKELVLIVGCLYCVERLCCQRQETRESEGPNTANALLIAR